MDTQREIQLQFLAAELYFGWILVSTKPPKVIPNHQKSEKCMQKVKVLAYMITAGRNIVISTCVARAFEFFFMHPTNAHQKNASRLQFESPKRIRGLQKDVDVILPKP